MIKKLKKRIELLLDKEVIRYAVSGVAAFLANAAVYYGLLYFGISYLIANIFSILASKTTAYLICKFWVYRTTCANAREFFNELFKFIVTRGLTGLLDYFGLMLLVEVFGGNEKVCKIIVMIAVIVLNYVFGKLIVFTKGKK